MKNYNKVQIGKSSLRTILVCAIYFNGNDFKKSFVQINISVQSYKLIGTDK